ncbi:hypothetical protein [Legionella sp. PC997]|uniref:hypothetical protein n=1 Tax=Legionella sp. PC997 TaxID=2755562 RepID=UPI0015F7ED0D|nr:hypothetical protein [Legionella sp. PC997]QMT60933.1 hypothetical protein HBNCFIEN_02322 [Legionella sp. PC997]
MFTFVRTMQNKYLPVFKKALDNYIKQSKRSHFSFNSNEKPIYKPDFFSSFRHSQKLYPALEQLQKKLTEANDEEAREIIKIHFRDKNNKWNNYSFNNYFLDEIFKIETKEDWEKEWSVFDKNPISYYQGILFRGSAEDISFCFKYGIKESVKSDFLEDYVRDMSGSIGVSTSKSFHVARSYALPSLVVRNEVTIATKPIWAESYIYLIDFKGKTAIDLESTFISRGETSCAKLSKNKEEVNIVGTISSEEIIGAFYVNRSGKIKWHINPKRKESLPYSLFESLLPKEFYTELIKEGKIALSHLEVPPNDNCSSSPKLCLGT